MPTLLDEILIKYVNQAYEAARLGRNRVQTTQNTDVEETLAELEASGDAMHFVDASGRIAWKATPRLRNRLMDLELDAQEDLEDI